MIGLDPTHSIAIYSGNDQLLRFLYDLLIQTKFYTIFSFLFGVGFYIFIGRAYDRGDCANLLFMRRLLLLFFIGSLHYLFFWNGDILHTYALVGFFLIFFYNRKAKTILVWAVALLVVYLLLISISFYSIASIPTEISMDNSNISHDKIFEYLSALGSEILAIPELLSLFLFGAFCAKVDLFRKISHLKKKIRIIHWTTLVFGIVFSLPIIHGYLTDNPYYSMNYIIWIMVAGKFLAAFYIITFLFICESKLGSRLFSPFSYVGKIALSNYLLQTCFGIIIIPLFIEDLTQLTLWQTAFIASVIFIIQTFLSKIWLSQFYFGPVEYLWRLGTYIKFQPLKKKISKEG